MIIQIIGLPGTGKTALAKEICRRTDAIHINGDSVRKDLSSDLRFSAEDRIEQARRLGAVSRLISDQGRLVVVDFVNPTEETRRSFGDADVVVWVDRITEGRFEDTNRMWEDPSQVDFRLPYGLSIEEEAVKVLTSSEIHDWTKPTTLQLGRYQPWHEGHSALYDAALERTDQVLVGVRNTHRTSEKDPLPYEEVEGYIRKDRPKALVLKLPNITNIIYGRDVGYKIEKIELSQALQGISATQRRKEMGIG
jgi:adenylate kinase family enzyme